MKFVADTGALLSIACSQYCDLLLKENHITITSGVNKELKEFGKYADFLGKKARSILQKNVRVTHVKVITHFGLEDAEEEVFALAEQKGMIALTDDIHASRLASENMKIVVRPSFYLLGRLYKQKKIRKQELIHDIQSILIHRHWLRGALWDYAIALIQKL